MTALLIVSFMTVSEIRSMEQRPDPREWYFDYERYIYRGTVVSIIAAVGFVAAQMMYELNSMFVTVVVISTYVNDAGAYLFGSTCGMRWIQRQFYKYSPNKTWEGTIGGLIVSVVMAAAMAHQAAIAGDGLWWTWPTMVITSAGAAIAGDALGSSLKRFIGVKDSSANSELWMGHGGWMDRFLASLSALAANMLLAAWLLLNS